MVGLHGAMNARASKLQGSGEVEGFGRQAESWSPTRFGRKHVPRLGSNRSEELKKWSIWEKANKGKSFTLL
ncbi:hypothetical protein FRX31_035412 [Thalictrum thalictroides]|uniref:Uncharacterized protein n=1 Tax=Thalictrum thalictroides TaxID=46969 RepID=A0A7J6URW6_THATH|nr:hypothetical protein FRX31_035412 [Thalictrum thalictroides]